MREGFWHDGDIIGAAEAFLNRQDESSSEIAKLDSSILEQMHWIQSEWLY